MGLSNLLGSRWRKDKSLSAEIPVGHITPVRTQQFWPKPALLLTFLTNATKECECTRLLRHTPVLSSQRLSASFCLVLLYVESLFQSTGIGTSGQALFPSFQEDQTAQ